MLVIDPRADASIRPYNMKKSPYHFGYGDFLYYSVCVPSPDSASEFSGSGSEVGSGVGVGCS